MERILNELTYEEEVTARLYSDGYEKKEIAELKCRAVSTVNNQLMSAFEKLGVKNGRRLATLIHERMTGVHLSFNLSDAKRAVVTMCLLFIFSLTFIEDGTSDMRRSRRSRTRTERRIRGDNSD